MKWRGENEEEVGQLSCLNLLNLQSITNFEMEESFGRESRIRVGRFVGR